MAVTLTYAEDLAPFVPDLDPGKAALMIEDALALAARVAPCIEESDFAEVAAAKAILRGAILRWVEAGQGSTVQQTAGPYQVSVTPLARRTLFWPSEVAQLVALCGTPSRAAFSIDTIPASDDSE
ncbi:MAG: hypothetical protein KDB18_12585 [Salinibacterium sp.]|nr:hypothetical protein [Salinibacterium sp.]